MRISDSRVLIIEDDQPKLLAVRQFFDEEFSGCEIDEARSLSSAIGVLSARPVDLAVVDMSLPTYELSSDESGGGTPQGFGGEDILRFIASEGVAKYSLVLTQYEEFPAHDGSVRTLEDLRSQLEEAIGSGFLGVVHYAGQQGEWRAKLKEVVQMIELRPE